MTGRPAGHDERMRPISLWPTSAAASLGDQFPQGIDIDDARHELVSDDEGWRTA
jgi:hypothetical protein